MTEYQRIFANVFKVGTKLRTTDGMVGVITSINNGIFTGTWGNNTLQINRDHFYKIG